MSDLHDLCKFAQRPVAAKAVEELQFYLKSGIPATYTIEEAYNYTHNIEDEPLTTTTPLHLICTHVPQDIDEAESKVVESMVEMLLEYGAGWCLTDVNNETPGCILIRRGLKRLPIYNQIVAAGIRAELLLRKVSEYDMEVISDTEEVDHERFGDEVPQLVEDKEPLVTAAPKIEKDDAPDAPSQNQESYLQTKLEYRDNALVTKDRQDGVMMSWETDLMRLGCDSLFKGSVVDGEVDSDINVLNIGFGMGIIDTMINEKNPTKHYICEAHPDVLKKLRDDGWYEKPNVVILEGRWQDQLDTLLSSGNTFFNGIYYDTYSEHYLDMLELFDFVVGLLKPHGVFSFFNGLGADRQVIYEVYKQLVEIDLSNYGLECKFTEIEVPKSTLEEKVGSEDSKSVWDDIKRSYWSCPVYYHPEARFIDV
ncbi:arginine N-methyltransferase 2 [Suhomyces tanzawaensis NRRL Y-17324]|uniref:Arginine N-methyltransferase 2 n=1 Tax=Suhomyces tanzawaensis NRRL Y-17324 TaxID=984487 RepID=A0A1E4SQ76_9ASCO|nr:arginine N-methyltransferase 2 [Suhomyces tanzawaensis NRRL Y-17324]ODV81656.1 arginine N-methyltransferase 2 [Suhomyces tanzawaensis NRRL Y-17324]